VNTQNLPSFSVVIRARNAAGYLGKVLDALTLQSVQPREVVVVDNESTDGSGEIAERYGARVVPIAKSDFTYGRALNMGLRECTGEVVFCISSHSLVLGREFFRTALVEFANPEVAAVRCTIVSKTRDLESWTQQKVLRWPLDLYTIVENGPIASGCAIRRSLWEEVPFDETLEAVEDKLWAREVMKRGYIVVSSEAMYLHMRRRGMVEAIQIMTRERRAILRSTGETWPIPRPTLPKLLKALLISAPQAAVRLAVREILLYGYIKSIPLQARWRPRAGSIV
jgi:glycosyltransferase involved in cell wall biosynthesis